MISRLLGVFRGWPVPARVISGVLVAAVAGVSVVAATGSGNSNRRVVVAPPTTLAAPTTSVVPRPAVTSTTVRRPTTTVRRTTTTVRRTGVPVLPATTTSTVVHPAAPPAPTTSSTASPSTTTTTVPGQGVRFCRATASNPTPAANSSEKITVQSNSANAHLTLTVYYRNPPGKTTYQSSPPVTTASGTGSVTFDVLPGSDNYPVVVAVNVATINDECETHFTPSS